MSSSPSSRRSRPTSAPSMDDTPSSSSSSMYMQRSSSADPGKVSKRKGTRSVSTLTAAQLARKRANDREAQRAIRARTKEHIERLEAELDELRSSRHRDPAVQELLRRNRMLEEELKSLRESMGITFSNSASYLTTGAVNSPRTSPYPPADFANAASSTSLPDYTSGYVPFAQPAPSSHAQGQTPSNCENWAAAVSASIPSNVSSPGSSADEYTAGPAYMPTSAPNPMVQSSPTVSSLRVHDDIKMEYEDGNDHGFPLETRSYSSGGGDGSTVGTPAMSTADFMVAQHPPGPWGAAQHSAVYYVPVQSPVY